MASNDLKNYIHTIRLSMGKIKHYQFMQGADMMRNLQLSQHMYSLAPDTNVYQGLLPEVF